jgi:hypothetical protein
MRYDSIEVKVWEGSPGQWFGHFRVIRDRQIVAEGEAPGNYTTEREARWNTERAGQRAAG